MAKNAHVLIVEDSLTQQLSLKGLLESNQYFVSVANNGKEAIALLENIEPDVILSDILMPEMDGYEFCKLVKSNERFRSVPVILLTALSDPKDVIRGLTAGADNFIPKPFSSEVLLSRINHLLANRKLRKEEPVTKGFEVFFGGETHTISSPPSQVMDLLLSTYESAVAKNNELVNANLELNQLKEDLEKKNSELGKANEEKNRFIGMAAHDIRNPLAGIYNFIDLLRDELEGKLDDQLTEFIDIIKSSVELLLNMVSELLDVTKIDAGKLVLKSQQNDIIAKVKKNITVNKFLADKKNITIQQNFCCDSLMVSFDSARIEQVLNNLITNAIKYSPENTRVAVGIKKHPDGVKFSIQDQGVGIRKGEMDKLFKPFSKTSAETTGGESSTGLGLFTCKKIIDAHNGEIGAISEHGKGSNFYFILPSDGTSEVTVAVVDEDKSTNQQLAGIKILVVDDIEMNYTYFKATLAKWSIVPDWIDNGKEAIDAVKKNDYDLILMDIHLPGMNGLDATREIRKFNKDVLIICQTAYSMEGMKEKCLAAGCNDYLPMPIRPKEVIAKIKENMNLD